MTSPAPNMRQPDAAYAVMHELRHFVSQAGLVATNDGPGVNPFYYSFSNGTGLRTTGHIPPRVEKLVTQSACLTEALVKACRLNLGPAGPSVEGVGLERVLIAYALANQYDEQCMDDWIDGRSQWQRDVCDVLSFFSQMAQRRYEKSNPQMTVAYYPVDAASSVGFGELGKPLLDDYRALLRLCRDAHTVLCVGRGMIIARLQTEFHDSAAAVANFRLAPMPPRLVHLRHLPREGGLDPVVFNLNGNGSLEVLAKSELVFRRVNNIWRFVTADEALTAIQEELRSVGADNATLVAHNLLSLAMDLADRGEGALLFLCDEPTSEVLGDLLDSCEGIIRSLPGLPLQELPARTRFTRLVGDQGLSLATGTYDRMSGLLRDICSIDGATIFSYGGDLLGFGCIVNTSALALKSQTPPRREGARSAAAKGDTLFGEHATTDAAGQFLIRCIPDLGGIQFEGGLNDDRVFPTPARDLQLQADLDGYMPRSIAIPRIQHDTSVTIRMVATTFVRGRLLTTGGVPLCDWVVTVLYPDQDFTFTTTDASGVFTIQLRPGTAFSIFIRKLGWSTPVHCDWISPLYASTTTTLDIVVPDSLLRPGRFVGTLADSNNIPVSSATIIACANGREHPVGAVRAGVMHFDPMAPGTYQVLVRIDGQPDVLLGTWTLSSKAEHPLGSIQLPR